MTDDPCLNIGEFPRGRREQQVEFPADLVRLSSDKPPGDRAPHTARAPELLEAPGFDVERYAVPSSVRRKDGMVSATMLVVRPRRRLDQERITTAPRVVRFTNSIMLGIRSTGLYRIFASPKMHAADPPTRTLETV